MTQFNLHNQYKAIVIGGSAGSFQGISKILAALPKDFELPIILCLHRLKHVRHGFVEALNIKSTISLEEPEDKESIKERQDIPGPFQLPLCIELGNTFSLSTEENG